MVAKVGTQSLEQYSQFDIDGGRNEWQMAMVLNDFQADSTVIDVEKILRGDKTYYQLSVDFDYSKDIDLSGGTVLGDFVAHPKTQNTSFSCVWFLYN